MSILYSANKLKILFIHIPKNGGRTIDSVLSKFTKKTIFIPGHPDISQIVDLKSIEILEEIDHIIYVKRNPYERASSIYNYFRNHSGSEHGHYLEKKYFLSNDFENSLSWLLSIRNDPEKLNMLTSSKWGNTTSYLAIKDQKSFVDLNFIQDANIREKIKKKLTCLNLENIRNDLDDFLKSVIKIDHLENIENLLNTSKKNYESIKTIKNEFSKKEKDLIKELFEEDFKTKED